MTNPVNKHGSVSPLAYLHSLIAPDGHVRYARGVNQTPVWVTGEALMALARKPLPLAAVPLPSGHHAAPSRPTIHGHAAHRDRIAPTRHRAGAAAAHAPASRGSLALAGDIGVLTALALAPVGVG